ncbi:MAG: TlpA family protein disulfide reductase [Verrucomicrobia bacterium]|nr:TlpA family protein disulfide reductase [Verrucomicrobiota bacterium]
MSLQRAFCSIRLTAVLLAVLLSIPALGDIIVTGKRGTTQTRTTASSDSTRPCLRWNNGEMLYGELDSATTDQVLWKSPLFSEPIPLLTSMLKVMESPKTGTNPQEPLAVILQNGDLIYGALVSINAETVKIQSESCSEVTLLRSEIVSLRRVSGGRLLYATPSPGVAWKMKDDRNGTARTTKTAWKSGSGGSKVLNSWNRTNYLPLKLPVKVEVEFHVLSTTSPRFRLDLNTAAGASPAIETWDDTLVLVYGGRFAPLLTLKAEDRDVSLRLCWDREGRRSIVFNAAGEQLAELSEKEGPRRGVSETGVYIQNTGLNLTLASLRVREWNNTATALLQPGKTRLEMMDGRVENGSVLSADDKTIQISTGSSSTKIIKLTDVESIILSSSPKQNENAQPNEVTFADGSCFTGKLIGIKKGIASLKTNWSTQPVNAKIDEAQSIRFSVPAMADESEEKPLKEMDRIVAGQTSFHGTPVGSEDGVLRWLPVGGMHPVKLALDAKDLEVIRTIPPDAPAVKAQALFFVDNGDVLPGQLSGIDENFVHLKSDLVELSRISAPRCYAVQFAGPDVHGSGFDDPGWRRVKGDAKNALLNGASLTLTTGGAFGHPTMMQTDELKFTLSSKQGFGVVRMRLFTDDLKAANRGTAILFMLSGNQLSCGIESENGRGFDRQGQFNSPSGQASEIRLVMHEKTIEVLVGDVSINQLPAPPEKRHGLGLAFELSNAFGNGERPMIISNFSAHLNSERIWFPPVDTEARTHALTIPRFRREDLPTHVLVANNGDMLRGRITAATNEHIQFQSGLELLNVPRNRVSAAIRLTPPVTSSAVKKSDANITDASPAPPAPDSAIIPTHWLLLRNGGRLGLAVEKFTPDKIVGRSANFGHCEVPMELVHILRFTPPPFTAAMTSFQSWKLEHMIDPVLPESGGQSSPLLGKDAKDFKLKLLDGTSFELSQEKGKVVVLDFWATWCGPCVKSLPEMIESMGEFDSSKVKFIGVNQAEPGPVVQTFLTQRGWKLTVALDTEQSVGRQFGVEGIPHTVIIGPDGKIAWMKSGYDPDGAKEAASAVRKLLKAVVQ